MAGYIGVDGKAGKVMNLYVGVDGTARQVVKAYVGDENGKARLWFERKKINFVMRIDAYPRWDFPGCDIPLEAYVGMDLHGFCFLKTTVEAFERESVEFLEVDPLALYRWKVNGHTAFYLTDATFVFQERHDGVTLDMRFNEVDP